MATYRKKPVEIQAMQWDGTARGAAAIIDWILDAGADTVPSYYEVNETTHKQHAELAIFTLEGRMTASPGDWIIIGVAGEVYPCKPDIFDATYELVEAPELTPQERETVLAFGIHEEDQ